MKKPLTFIIGLFSWVLIGSFVIIMGMALLSNFNLLQGYRSFLVQSGSMEPSIKMGDVVITTKTSQYLQGDVISFLDRDGRTVTHRILEVEETNGRPLLITKGDANQARDRDEITTDQILGKIALVIPKLGFVIAFSRTPLGFLILIIIPAGIIAFDELKVIYKTTKKKVGSASREKSERGNE